MKRILFLFIAITSLRAADAFIPSPVTPTDWLTVGGTTPTGSSTGQVKIGGGHIMLGALSGGINYLLTQENNTGTGSMVIQAGAGSADFGAAIKLHARAHALHPGELWLGGSSGIGDTVIGNGAAIGPPGNISQILRIGRSGVSTFYGVSPGTTVTAGQVKIGGGKVLAAGMIDSNSNMNAAGYGLNTVGTATGDYRALGRTSASAIILRSYSSNEGGNGNLVLASADNNGIYSFLTVLGGSGPFGIFQGNDPGSTVSGQEP